MQVLTIFAKLGLNSFHLYQFGCSIQILAMIEACKVLELVGSDRHVDLGHYGC